MNITSPPDADLTALMDIIEYTFTDSRYLKLALTHSSLTVKNNLHVTSNERLEFLGDRVLGLVVAEILLEHFPEEDEGEISRRHAALVRMETLAAIAGTLDLGNFIYMSRGEERMGGRKHPALLADTCEAIIAALYMDGGLVAASKFIRTHWQTDLDKTPLPPKDAKTMLQEWAQKNGLPIPSYWEVKRDGPAHKPIFTVAVKIASQGQFSGIGQSKRNAEQKAAERMLEKVSLAED